MNTILLNKVRPISNQLLIFLTMFAYPQGWQRGRSPVTVWTPGGSTCEDTHEDTPKDPAHVWPQVWCYHTWGHTCAHKCGKLLMGVFMCAILLTWGHTCSFCHTCGHRCGLTTCLATHVDCSSGVSSFGDFTHTHWYILFQWPSRSALPIGARCSDDLDAWHYRLMHAVPMT